MQTTLKNKFHPLHRYFGHSDLLFDAERPVGGHCKAKIKIRIK